MIEVIRVNPRDKLVLRSLGEGGSALISVFNQHLQACLKIRISS